MNQYQFIQIDGHFFSIADIIRIRFTTYKAIVVIRSIDSRLVGEDRTIPFASSEEFEFDSQEPAYAALKSWVSNRSLVLVSEAEAQAYCDEQRAIQERERMELLAQCSVMLEEAGIKGYELSGSQRYGYEFSVNGRRIWRNVEHEDLEFAVREHIEKVARLQSELSEVQTLLNAQQDENNPATSWAITEIEDSEDHDNPDAPYYELWYGSQCISHRCPAKYVLPTVKEYLERRKASQEF